MHPESWTMCEWCEERIWIDDPGAIFLVWDETHRPGESIPLHSSACRAKWFSDYPPSRWIIDHRVKDVM